MYAAKLTYEYRVAGKTYRGGRLGWAGEIKDSWKRRAERIVEAYPVGQAVEVHYDPNDRAQAVLEPLRRQELLINAAIALVIGAFLLGWVFQENLGDPQISDWSNVGRAGRRHARPEVIYYAS